MTEAKDYADAKAKFLVNLENPAIFATGLANISLAKQLAPRTKN